MHKKIAVEELQVGMYIHDLGVPWQQHDFLLPRFKVQTPETVNAIRACTPWVTIDTDKGIDVPPHAPSSTPAPATEAPPLIAKIQRVELQEELIVARKLLREARDTVKHTMEDARTGTISSIPQMREVAQRMMESTSRHPGALLSLVGLKTKDDYTFSHCVAVGAFMIALGKQLGLGEDELREAGTAGLLHDVGKSHIPAEILNKPGRLTESEFAVVRMHPQLGYQTLLETGYADSGALDVVRHHHERLDGQGYPSRLDSAQITRLMRMSTIADVYDAVTSERVYHKAMPPTAALQMLLSGAGTQFDGDIVRAFIKTVGIYPNRSLVRLRSGRLAVVLEQHPVNTVAPIVKVFFSVNSDEPILPYVLNLAHGTDTIVSFEDPGVWNLDIDKHAATSI
ncbi:MAG TPA: HD-GYP domain-containing protein [Burkholderiales bacterium]